MFSGCVKVTSAWAVCHRTNPSSNAPAPSPRGQAFATPVQNIGHSSSFVA
ncbi:MAG TPA: hypothetical protein VGD87_05615 [Archangium sp.]